MQCTSVQCATWSNYYLSKNIHMDSSNISLTTIPDNLKARHSTDHYWYVYTGIQSFFLLEYKTAKSLHEWVMQSVTGDFSSSLQCMGCVLYIHVLEPIYYFSYNAHSNMTDHDNLLGDWRGTCISSSCKDSEVVIILWHAWTGCGEKTLILCWPKFWNSTIRLT